MGDVPIVLVYFSMYLNKILIKSSSIKANSKYTVDPVFTLTN